MDANLLRNIGITIGAAAMAGALALSQMARQAAAPTAPQPVASAPVTDAAEQAPVFETANAEAPPPAQAESASFVVRFKGSGPLAQAQGLAARGRDTEARRAAEQALSRQSALRGLCFDRFTVGGAEMVLRTCGGGNVDWLARLRGMSSVQYAELNSTAAPAQPQ